MRKIIFRGKRIGSGEWVQGGIALLEKEFPDEPTSMAYRDALALAVQALEKERDRG